MPPQSPGLLCRMKFNWYERNRKKRVLWLTIFTSNLLFSSISIATRKSFARVFDWFKNRKFTIDISAKEIAAYCTIVPLVYVGGCNARDLMYRALGFKVTDLETTVLKQYEVIEDLISKDTLERDVQYKSIKAILEWDRKCAHVPLAHIEDGLKYLKNDCNGKWKVDAWKIHGAAEKLKKQIEDLELFLGGEKGED